MVDGIKQTGVKIPVGIPADRKLAASFQDARQVSGFHGVVGAAAPLAAQSSSLTGYGIALAVAGVAWLGAKMSAKRWAAQMFPEYSQNPSASMKAFYEKSAVRIAIAQKLPTAVQSYYITQCLHTWNNNEDGTPLSMTTAGVAAMVIQEMAKRAPAAFTKEQYSFLAKTFGSGDWEERGYTCYFKSAVNELAPRFAA